MTALAYVIGDGRGALDRLLSEVATSLAACDVALAGVVQVNTDRDETHHCNMDLQVLGRVETVRISQHLGNAALGCRLDPEGLETAVGLVEATVDGAALLIVNKFGKTEGEGRGFRPVIARALGQGIPVLIGVSRDNLPLFQTFCEDLGDEIPADLPDILEWVTKQFRHAP